MTDIRICFVGDSFVNGTGDSSGLGWVGRVCVAAQQASRPAISLTYYNLGIRRDTSADITRRWHAEVTRRLPPECDGRVVFSFGTNDTTLEGGQPRVDLAQSIQYAQTLLTAACRQFPVLMVSPAPLIDSDQTSRIAQLSHHLKQVCDELAIPYLDVLTPLRRSPIWLHEAQAGDGAHPNAAGYAVYAQLVQHWSAWSDWFVS